MRRPQLMELIREALAENEELSSQEIYDRIFDLPSKDSKGRPKSRRNKPTKTQIVRLLTSYAEFERVNNPPADAIWRRNKNGEANID